MTQKKWTLVLKRLLEWGSWWGDFANSHFGADILSVGGSGAEIIGVDRGDSRTWNKKPGWKK